MIVNYLIKQNFIYLEEQEMPLTLTITRGILPEWALWQMASTPRYNFIRK